VNPPPASPLVAHSEVIQMGTERICSEKGYRQQSLPPSYGQSSNAGRQMSGSGKTFANRSIVPPRSVWLPRGPIPGQTRDASARFILSICQ
jgi:hypothetical protein